MNPRIMSSRPTYFKNSGVIPSSPQLFPESGNPLKMAASNTSDLKLYNNMGFVEFEREYQPHWSCIWSSAPLYEIKHFNFAIKHLQDKTFTLKLGRVFAIEISEKKIYNRVPWRIHRSQRFFLIFLHAEKLKRREKSKENLWNHGTWRNQISPYRVCFRSNCDFLRLVNILLKPCYRKISLINILLFLFSNVGVFV